VVGSDQLCRTSALNLSANASGVTFSLAALASVCARACSAASASGRGQPSWAAQLAARVCGGSTAPASSEASMSSAARAHCDAAAPSAGARGCRAVRCDSVTSKKSTVARDAMAAARGARKVDTTCTRTAPRSVRELHFGNCGRKAHQCGSLSSLVCGVSRAGFGAPGETGQVLGVPRLGVPGLGVRARVLQEADAVCSFCAGLVCRSHT
jgi:hypothetical protein